MNDIGNEFSSRKLHVLLIGVIQKKSERCDRIGAQRPCSEVNQNACRVESVRVSRCSWLRAVVRGASCLERRTRGIRARSINVIVQIQCGNSQAVENRIAHMKFADTGCRGENL